MALIACPECDAQIFDRAPTCPKCGYPTRAGTLTQRTDVEVPVAKSRGLAVVLALFLGGLGAHKFYVEKPGVGLAYLIFCWTFIPALLGLLEAIQYILMSEKTFQRKFHDKKL